MVAFIGLFSMFYILWVNAWHGTQTFINLPSVIPAQCCFLTTPPFNKPVACNSTAVAC
jgi:hypothetical protein